jgi:hypothetical protein
MKRNVLERVSALGVDGEESVTGFVVGGGELVLSGDVSRLARGTHHDLLEGKEVSRRSSRKRGEREGGEGREEKEGKEGSNRRKGNVPSPSPTQSDSA